MQRNETFQTEYYNYCINSKHPNVFICPNEGMFKDVDDHQKKVTKIFKYFTFLIFYQLLNNHRKKVKKLERKTKEKHRNKVKKRSKKKKKAKKIKWCKKKFSHIKNKRKKRKKIKKCRNNIRKSIHGKEYGEEYDNEEDATNEDFEKTFYEIPILQFEPINFDDNLIHEDKRGVSGYVE